MLDQYVADKCRFLAARALAAQECGDVEFDVVDVDRLGLEPWGFDGDFGGTRFHRGRRGAWRCHGLFEDGFVILAATGGIHAGREEGDGDLLGRVFVEHLTHEDVGFFGVGELEDVLHGLLGFANAEVFARRDVDQDAFGSLNGGFEHRGVGGVFGGEPGSVVAGGRSHAHEGDASILHDGLDVGEVDVDETGLSDDVADALDSLAENVIGGLESACEGSAVINDVRQAGVGDHDEGVDLFFKLAETFERDFFASGAFESEGAGDDADSEDI